MPRWFQVLAYEVALARSRLGDGRFTPTFPLWWALDPSRTGVFFLKERSDEPSHGHPVALGCSPRAFTQKRREPRTKIVSEKPHVNGALPTSTQMPSACRGPPRAAPQVAASPLLPGF
jgi:hypothetical protein